MTGKAVRCAIYTRKSSEEGLDQNFNSLHAQREACEAYVLSQKHEGWEVIRTEYDDGGFSGGTMERPGLKRLLADIAAKRVDTVVVYKVDRLTRSLADFAKIVEQFDGQGVSFVSVTQQFNTTSSMGRLTLNVLLSFAQFEREVTGERIRDKIAASKRKGMWMGGTVPLGYDLQNRTLSVNMPEAEQVRLIYQTYLELGCVSKLRLRLEELGIRSKSRVSSDGRPCGGAKFSRGALYLLLQNRLYLGEIRHKEVSYPGQHEAIVSRELWQAAQLLLRQNRPPGPVHPKGQEVSWLTGLLFDTDGTCFTPMHTTKRGKRYRYYVSQALLQGKNTERPRLPAPEIEGIVLGELEAVLREPQRLFSLVSDRPDHPAEMQAIVKAANAFRARANKPSPSIPAVQRVMVDTDRVTLTVSRGRLREALGLDGLSFAPDETELAVPANVTRSRGVLRFKVEGRGETAMQERPVLLEALATSRRWLDLLLSGQHARMNELAALEGCDVRYVSRLLPLAFLSPEITEAVLDGRHPEHWSINTLLDRVPLDWAKQNTGTYDC